MAHTSEAEIGDFCEVIHCRNDLYGLAYNIDKLEFFRGIRFFRLYPGKS